MDALPYNRSQNLNPDDVVEIQRTVGAKPDGIWGPETVAKIIAWQTACGRAADGRVDAATLAEFRARWAHDDDLTGDEALDDVAGGHLAPEPDLEATTLVTAGDGYVRLEDLERNDAPTLAAVQNDLFAFGFEPGLPDGQCCRRSASA